MIKKSLLFILVFSGFLSGNMPYTKAAELTPAAHMYMLTASPGEELYSVFGHSALWVLDPEQGINEVYNWGTFDFQTPNFYMKFLRGRLMYHLTVTSLERFLMVYRYEGRGVYSQRLNLRHDEMLGIYDYLLINRRPENVEYLYDFFYDNCATRIRDIADKELDIDWGPDPHPHAERTFRQMLHPYVAHIPWISFGIDILLGLPSDKAATPWHYMFLPDEMFIAFEHARHDDGRLLVDAYDVFLEKMIERDKPGLLTPVVFFWILFGLGLLSLLNAKLSRIFDRIFFTALGLLGVLVFFMWFLSDHIPTAQNLNILWALPTHLYFIHRGTKGRSGRMTRLYFKIVFLISAALLLFWPWIPQEFHPAFFPIIALIAVKAGLYGWGRKKEVSLEG